MRKLSTATKAIWSGVILLTGLFFEYQLLIENSTPIDVVNDFKATIETDKKEEETHE